MRLLLMGLFAVPWRLSFREAFNPVSKGLFDPP